MNPFHPQDPRYNLWEEIQESELLLQIITIEDEEEIIPDAILWYIPIHERN